MDMFEGEWKIRHGHLTWEKDDVSLTGNKWIDQAWTYLKFKVWKLDAYEWTSV